MSNRLSKEKSPYLLQHAENPVNWFAWGEEAFEKARAERKPVFLSIGYATCHWCHVMAHESFEDPEVARVLNESYVAVKVDREERPDVDQVYMTACQVMTGQGGWPLSAFLTPEGKPFFVGTYFPKTSRFGRPGLLDLLTQLADKWGAEQETVRKAADQLIRAMKRPVEPSRAAETPPDLSVLEAAYGQHERSFDQRWAGFGQAPKFPTPHHLTFLLRWHLRRPESKALEMVEKTLQAMYQGGIFDQIGRGFHRYSVDAQWLVPHFEKMLYDQALLAMACTEAFQLTGKPLYEQAVRDIFTYVLRDMTSPEGAFYAAEDADSDGREGLFYVWRPDEVRAELGDEAGDLFCRYYGITPAGNFENGLSIPHVPVPLEFFARREGLEPGDLARRLEEGRARLFTRRNGRVHPFKDDKILTAWNGLMIAALAKAAQALDEPEYLLAADRAFDFIADNLMREKGRLMRRHRDGETAFPGFLDDYAFLVWGLIELYEAGFNVRHLEEALKINQAMLDLFWDEPAGGLFFSGKENELLITRQKELYDGALPSGNSAAALNLLRLARMTGSTVLEEKADKLIRFMAPQAAPYPMAHSHFLTALDFVVGPGQEMVIAGEPGDEAVAAMAGAVRRRFLPNKVLLLKSGGASGRLLEKLAPYTAELGASGERAAFYLCRGFACQRPMTETAEVEAALTETAAV